MAGIVEVKQADRMQEWSTRIAECRTSGMGVKAWCKSQGIAATTYYHWEKRFVEKATQQMTVSNMRPSVQIKRIDPGLLSGNETSNAFPGITIQHGESVVCLPAGSDMETVADLVKALNRHV